MGKKDLVPVPPASLNPPPEYKLFWNGSAWVLKHFGT